MLQVVSLDDLGQIGVIRDSPAHEIPPEAWTTAFNMRILEDSIQRLQGKTQVLGTPTQPPIWALYISSSAAIYWLYYGATDGKIFVYNGSTHTQIGDLSTVTAPEVNGTILGGIPIINNGADIPQFWALPYNIATALANVTNWPSTLRARVLRAFGPILIALNVTESGTNKPHKMRWSHPADPGGLPATWDITDATKDAGEVEFPDVESGIILDGLPLQGRFYVYKENSVWRVRHVGGRFIFDEDPFLETIGLLSTRCVAMTADGGGHTFAGQDNLWIHDGNRAVPLLDKKMKRTVFNSLDPAQTSKSFVFTNPRRNETWFCYAETGSVTPNRALIVQQRPPFQCTEAEIDFIAAANGVVEIADPRTWATIATTWATEVGAWSTTAGGRRVVLCNQAATKLQLLDYGNDNDGAAITGTLQRTGLGIIGRKRNGDWNVDFQQRKLVTRLWPKITGGSVSIRVGWHKVPDGAITWSAAKTFDPTTQLSLTFNVEGPAIAIEISGTTFFKVDGFKVEFSLTGKF